MLFSQQFNTDRYKRHILCCMVLAMLMIDADKSLDRHSLQLMRHQILLKGDFHNGRTIIVQCQSDKFAQKRYLRPSQKENLYQRLMSCNSSFIFSRRDDQRNRRLPANNDEIRSSSRSLSFSLEQSRSCSSSEGNGQIMKGCSI